MEYWANYETDEMTFRLPPEGPQRELFTWWMSRSYLDYQQGAPKVDEYGAHDLELMGMMLLIFGYKDKVEELRNDLPVGTEIAVWFYTLGKVARLLSDYLAKRPGKGDTWHDITFYSMMARRIQSSGGWPC